MKRLVCFIVTVVMVFGCFSCSSEKTVQQKDPAEIQFENDAQLYFDRFKDIREGGSSDVSICYSEDGSYALELAVTDSAADGDIKSYCDSLINEFEGKKASGDRLFISYRLYGANDNVGTVEIVSDMTLGEKTESKTHMVNFDKKSDTPVSDALKRAVTAHAALEGKEIAADAVYIFKSDGLYAGDYMIDYKKVCPTLPAGLKETVDDGSRVIDLSKKLVAITYDDGPCELTDEFLDIYEEHRQVATFFEVGQLMSSQPEALKRMDKLGCEIGSHTWSHKDLTKISAAEIQSQMNKTDNSLEKILGKKATLMRPPYGAVNGTARNSCGKPMIGWSLDTLDWQSRNANKVINVVKNAGDLDGQVILMHSLYESTLEATRELVPWLKENGYELVTVSELFKYKFNSQPENGKYYTAPYFTK